VSKRARERAGERSRVRAGERERERKGERDRETGGESREREPEQPDDGKTTEESFCERTNERERQWATERATESDIVGGKTIEGR